jgi:uncharacterized membrane protein AbrB (regulator of aidB expression)
VVAVVTFVCVAVLTAAFAWGRKYWFWRNGKIERSTAAFWKWK